MARKPTSPPQDLVLDAEQIGLGIERIRRRVAELEAFDPTSVKERWAPETKAIEASIDEALSKTFGHETPRYRRYESAARLDRGPLIIGRGPDPIHRVHEWVKEGKDDALALLRQAAKSLEEDQNDLGVSVASETVAPVISSAKTNDIFVIHGHDSHAKTEVARLIERAGLNAVILHEQPNKGRTIAEKLEHHGSAAGFAVAVLTPDDIGGVDKDHLQPRARQNVVGELFWFAGKLGRARVCALMKSKLEIPSDFAGVVFTDMDDRGAWKAELLRELAAAGYAVDWAKAMA